MEHPFYPVWILYFHSAGRLVIIFSFSILFSSRPMLARIVGLKLRATNDDLMSLNSNFRLHLNHPFSIGLGNRHQGAGTYVWIAIGSDSLSSSVFIFKICRTIHSTDLDSADLNSDVQELSGSISRTES